MSYEGYTQILCKSGHYHTFDCYVEPDFDTWKCPYCGELAGWLNSVDETNGQYDDYIDKKKEKILMDNNVDYFEDSTPKKHWTIQVDESDGYFYGYNKESDFHEIWVKLFKAQRIDGYVDLKIKEEAKICECKECGDKHSISCPTYHIPKKGGHRVND